MTITIRDVAKFSGVSVKTVSRIINNEAPVREDTRAKVQRAMDELGYRPSVLAQRFARGHSRVIGLLIHRGNNSEYAFDILHGLMEICTAEGYGVSIFAYHREQGQSGQDVTQLIAQQFVDGLVFTPGCDDVPEQLAELDRMGAPFVRIWPQRPELPYPSVSAQDRQGAFELISYLISLGHQRIGIITGEMDHADSPERLVGYQAALEAHQIAFDASLVQYGDYSFASGRMCGRTLLKQNNPPTAIFASSDEMAVGVLHIAHELGIMVPKQLSVAGFDDSRMSQRVLPLLTTVRQPVSEMGRIAAQILIRRLNGQTLAQTNVVLSTSLVIRNSTAPIDRNTSRSQ